MKELRIGDRCNPMEYIVTFHDGKQVRMLLDANEYEHIKELVTYLDRSRVLDICDYGSKDLYCQGS